MLNFQPNQLVDSSALEAAVVTIGQASLTSVAAATGMELLDGSMQAFTSKVVSVIRRPDITVSPVELATQAELLAIRGALAMAAAGEKRFHEWTWEQPQVSDMWPWS